MAYTWKWKLEERGFKRVFTANYTEVQEKKMGICRRIP